MSLMPSSARGTTSVLYVLTFTYLFSLLCVLVSMCVGAINVLVTSGDSNKLLTCLQDDRCQLSDVHPQYIDAYLHQLTELKNKKQHAGCTHL